MNKVLALIVTVFLTLSVNAQKVNWVSLEEAVELQEKSPKKIFMDVYTNWCGPCKLLDKKTFQNAEVADYINKHYYAVKFNAEGNETITFKNKTYSNPNYDPAKANKRNSVHELTRFFGVRAYPTMVFLDENLEFLAPIRGYKTPQQLELYLKLFKNDHHKDLTTQEAFDEYYTAFKPEWTGE
ncbi:MAG: thioredoxin fold domain-containing protein [Flavobacteriaceae bacterium]|nr:thioredoxin fold domain-containing protein [Bacteroidia bacterium]NNK87644.1 thioredoxin fold domain-containing protein [Flavobacteriaceae bacterium]